MLCENRPEGFGPRSRLSSPVPTACFVDVILVPVPVWIAIALLPLLLLASKNRPGASFNPENHASWLYRTIAIIYYILIVCNILMETLEIVRLSLLRFGVGLLPFVYVGLILGALLHWSKGAHGRIRFWQAINGVIWVGGVVMSVVKAAGLAKEGIDGRKGSKYPMSDQVLDVAVMAGVYAVVGILEVILGVWNKTRSSGYSYSDSGNGGRRSWRK